MYPVCMCVLTGVLGSEQDFVLVCKVLVLGEKKKM